MRRVLLLAVLSVLAVSVSADFQVSVFPTERTVKLNETAVFEVELSHDAPVEELFEVYSNDVTWDVRAEKQLRVAPGQIFKANLLITPLNLNPGAYNLPVNFKRAGSSDVKKQFLYVELLSPFPEDVNYLPAVRGVATLGKEVDPRRGVVLKLSLENQNRRILDKVDVKVRSRIINKDYTTRLGPLEKKTLTFIADVDPLTPPQKDVLQISIIVPEKERAYQFDLLPLPYEVIGYGSVVPSVSTEKEFLKRVETVTLVNQANKPLTHVYRVPAWFAKRWFISSAQEANVEGGELVWEIPLEPGASKTVLINYNYRPLFWLFLVAAVVVAAYYLFRSPIAVMKRAVVVGSHEEGITELKVVVELVNRSGKAARNVRVMDLVPHLAEVVKETRGTILEPSKIVPHEQRGTLVRWDIDMMDPKEHRILMYRVKTKLSVLGGMTLPVAAVHFVVDGHEREAVSNKPMIRHGL